MTIKYFFSGLLEVETAGWYLLKALIKETHLAIHPSL